MGSTHHTIDTMINQLFDAALDHKEYKAGP